MRITITKTNKGLALDKGLTDVFKFVTCILIAFHHYSQYATNHSGGSNWFYLLLSAVGGYLGVALFFFLSGYGLIKSEQKQYLPFKVFVTRRFMKVFFPVLLVTIFWIPIYLSLGFWDGPARSFLYNALGGIIVS